MTGLAQNPWHFLKLVHLTAPWEQWPKCIEFGHDAPQSKNIDRIIITATAKDILGRTVPPGRHILRERRRMAYFFNQTEITEFNCGLILNENILRFDVSMEETVLVDVV